MWMWSRDSASLVSAKPFWAQMCRTSPRPRKLPSPISAFYLYLAVQARLLPKEFCGWSQCSTKIGGASAQKVVVGFQHTLLMPEQKLVSFSQCRVNYGRT